jgi:hypothetical protein
MFTSSQLTRSAAIAATVCSLGAGPAMARPADQAARPAAVVWTQPRVDGMGVRPADHPVSSAAPAVPLTRAADASGGADWLLITIAAATLLALLAILAVMRPGRRAHPFRARQI